MENTRSHDQNKFKKELEETELLKSIPKNRLLQAPPGYYEHLNFQILNRIKQGKDQQSAIRTFSIPALARWTAAAAAIAAAAFLMFESRPDASEETILSSKPVQIESVENMDSSILESSILLSLDEQVLAEELMTTNSQQQPDSVILHEELTEYLLLHADHDLLIESL